MSLRRWLPVFALLLIAPVFAETRPTTALDRMKADLQFLTSNECEGRGPGTKGIELAADRIAATFKEAGLKPALPDGSYFQPFQVKGSAKLGTPIALAMSGPDATVQPKLNNGYSVIGMGGEGKAAAEVVFVGHGITSKEQNYDDYAGLDVNGKIVMILRRTPRYSDKDKPFAPDAQMAALSAMVPKLENAEKHGAAGVILVNDAGTAADSRDDIAQFSRIVANRTVKIPAVHVKRHLASGLIKAAYGKSIGEIEDEIDRDLKPLGKVLKDCTAEIEVTIEKAKMIDTKNVVAVLEGKGPFADETIVVGAHYDHLGYGGSGSLAGAKVTTIHHGADDNGSGTTAVMELARRFGAMKDREGRRLVFMTFSAEEMGLLGSAHYCKNPIFPLDKTVAMVNLDMVGRLAPDKETKLDKMEIGGTGTAKGLDPMIDKYNEKYKFQLKKSAGGMGPSDHQSFFLKNLPVLFFFTGIHVDYHRPSDTVEKVNFDGMARIVDMVEEVTRDLAAGEKLEFVKVAGSGGRPFRQDGTAATPGMPRVRLGVMPDYTDEKEGVLLQGVSPGGPAEKAGLKEGDRILTMAGNPVKNVTGYMEQLGKCEKGKVVELGIKRKDETLTIKVTPE